MQGASDRSGLGAGWRERRGGQLAAGKGRACRPVGPERRSALRVRGLLCRAGRMAEGEEGAPAEAPENCSWGSNPPSALPFPCCLPPEGPWHPRQVLGSGTRAACVVWGSRRVGICDRSPPPPGSDPLFPLAPPQWWSPWSPVQEPRPTSTGNLSPSLWC